MLSAFTKNCIFGTFIILIFASIIIVLYNSSWSLTHFASIMNTGSTNQSELNTITSIEKNLQKSLSEVANMVKVSGVDCKAIFSGSKNETTSALGKKKVISSQLPDQFYLNLTVECADFQKRRGYIMSCLTEEEKQFPLAFSMLVYKDVEMVERLFRAVYRPQNLYCIHVDSKSSPEFYAAVSAISNCFTNVFVTTRRITVVWGTFTVLEAELLCMEEIWRFPKWKYFINLTGQEFPLKTNLEIVKILTAYNGASDVTSTRKRANKNRWNNTVPPFGIKATKGSVHIVAHRNFIDYILHNKTAKALLEWTKKTRVPDETFFSTLNSNPQLGIKSTYKGEPEHSSIRPTFVRFKNWGGTPCAGRRVREICILSTGDLTLLAQSNQMFANKFHLNEDRVVIGCLEEKLFNDTRDGYMGTKIFNSSYYGSFDFVINQVK